MTALKTILYFSVFKYPLKLEEIYQLSSSLNIEKVENDLETLVRQKIVYKFGEFYYSEDDDSVVKRRQIGNKMAEAIFPKAIKRAKLIFKFPFVKSVSVSGSLSKNYYDNDGDIDFFIITQPNYLWLGRTFLILYKKLFLLNSKKHFCVNYFISSNSLKITEQNKFTATEIATLKPIYGRPLFLEFLNENQWFRDFYPNKKVDLSYIRPEFEKPLWSRLLQWALRNKLGRAIDGFLKTLTLKKWQRKFKQLNRKNFDIAMKSTNDVSKHHPQDFQSKVITKLNKKYMEHNKAHNLELTLENA